MHSARELAFGGQQMVDKDRLKGAINEVAGRAKRQVGEWTGDTKTQVDGAAQQVKGKVEKMVGTMKDEVKDDSREREIEERERLRL